MALYSYFADKQALLTALALEGFEKVAKRFDSTVHRDPLTAVRKNTAGLHRLCRGEPLRVQDSVPVGRNSWRTEANPRGLAGTKSGFWSAIQARGSVHQGRVCFKATLSL